MKYWFVEGDVHLREHYDMKIWGVNRAGLDFALALGSANFGGNVKFYAEPKRHGKAWRLRLQHVAVGPGSRCYHRKSHVESVKQGPIGHRGPAVCCHVYKEFFRAIFEINEDARIATTSALYRNKVDFEAKMDAYVEPYPKHCECDV